MALHPLGLQLLLVDQTSSNTRETSINNMILLVGRIRERFSFVSLGHLGHDDVRGSLRGRQLDRCVGKVSLVVVDSGASRLDVRRKELVGRAHKDHRRKAISVVFWFWLDSTRAVLGVEF